MATPAFPQTFQPITLPVELIHALNQTYFLHLLANDPDKVIPPGKSLLSMLAHSHVAFQGSNQFDAENDTLRESIRQVAQRAFWDEALEALSSPQPSLQLRRLGLLYSDLKDALLPLFPSHHPPLLTLSSPLSPTTSPLHSSAIFLKEILASLKQRCAPIRDQEIDDAMILLDGISSPLIITDPGILQIRNRLIAKVVISVIQSILTVAEVMKEDLNKFVFGAMTDTQLKSVVQQQAKARERELILRIWNVPEGQGQHIIREKWCVWVDELEDGLPIDDGSHQVDRWKRRLLQALQSPTPVSCNDLLGSRPDRNTLPANDLPPQFLFALPNLLSIQNYIQALVISAALRSLLRAPVYSESSDLPPATTASYFVQRVWTLLAGEIEANEAISRLADVGDTKIAHLADELVHARRMLSEVGVDEEARLRAATQHILRPEDPVYVLLQRRVLAVLRGSLSRHPSALVDRGQPLPEKLRTGKYVATGVGKMWLDTTANDVGATKRKVPPKGFEEPVLTAELDRLSSKLASCIAWVDEVWGDLTG
ncbi:hypothetical protein F5887DRAFT_964000 [Amanita rubescens]|nr:hypothetical protein F5887DRAFT_964000 [Amanita rubescens]